MRRGEGKGRRRGLKYTTEFRNCTLFPLLMNKGIGSVDLDQGFAPDDVWMHAYSSQHALPACLLKNSDTGATVVQLGYNIAAATVFVLFNAASLNLGKTKL